LEIPHIPRQIGPELASSDSRMSPPVIPRESIASKPICVGLTCWRWESKRSKTIVELAKNLGVTLQLTQTVHGLHREIEARVSGQNTDRFINEFVRHC
jgi:hypothetical protein